MSAPPKRFAPPPPRWPHRPPGPPAAAAPATSGLMLQRQVVQRQVIQPQATFNALRGGKGERVGAGDELMRMPGDQFLLNTAGRNLRVKPNGTYNFVRVQGNTRNDARTFVSANSGHAGLAAGRPVLYAGTVRFDSGALDWWSNYSGTYQPMAAFRQQAHLPDDRFVPWQRLQMGGVGLQRGMLSDQRSSTVPAKPEGAAPPKPVSRAAEPAKAEGAKASPAQPQPAPPQPARAEPPKPQPTAGATVNAATATTAAAPVATPAGKGR